MRGVMFPGLQPSKKQSRNKRSINRDDMLKALYIKFKAEIGASENTATHGNLTPICLKTVNFLNSLHSILWLATSTSSVCYVPSFGPGASRHRIREKPITINGNDLRVTCWHVDNWTTTKHNPVLSPPVMTCSNQDVGTWQLSEWSMAFHLVTASSEEWFCCDVYSVVSYFVKIKACRFGYIQVCK